MYNAAVRVIVCWLIVTHVEAVQNAAGPLLVEIDRPFCCSLGIDLISATCRGRTVICISNIVPASIADRFIVCVVCISQT